MSFSRIVLGIMGVPVLHPNPCVEGWIMYPLSNIESINDMTWAREGQDLNKT